MKTRLGLVVTLCLLALPVFADGGPRRRLPLEPCPQPGSPKGALCGRHEVFEDRETRAGRKIALNVMVLPATSKSPALDPVFYLAGGPGAAATAYAEALFMEGLRRTRDVVLVDQRGTGGSNPLVCRFFGDPEDMRGYFGESFAAAAVRECRDRLERVADLRLYTTPAAMADLDEVRDALGYERVNVYGGSYGSMAALAYLHFYPKRVRTVSLLAVAPLDYKLPLPFARGVEHALERLFADCAGEARCRAAFPELRREFAAVVARLEKAPATFEALNPYTGQRQQITLTRASMFEHLRVMLYIPNVTSALPALIHEMHGGEYARFAAVGYQVLRQIDAAIARGMQLSVLCTEHLPFVKEEDIRRETAGTFYGDSYARQLLKACEQWPRGKVAPRYLEPVKSDVPVLIVSGDLDPVTPPWVGAALLGGLPNGRQVVAHNATHNSYECLESLVAEFINKGTAQGLDTSCAERIQRPPFITALPPVPRG